MKKTLRLLISLLPLLIVAACGGGGGSAPAGTSAGPAPTVAAVTPADAATGVVASTTIKVTFSVPMDPATITASSPAVSAPAASVPTGTFTVSYDADITSINAFNNMTTARKRTIIGGTVTADSTNRIFTFTPTSPLTVFDPITGRPLHTPQTYRVTIKGGASGVKEAGGVAMTVDHVTTFTVWAGTQQAGSIANDVINGIAADSDGNSYLAGYTNGSLGATTGTFGGTNADGSGQTSDILLTKYDANGAVVWTQQLGSPSQVLGTGATINYDDRAYGFALDNSSGSPQLVAAGYTDGTLPLSSQVNPAQANPDPTGATHNYFVVKYDGDGNLMWTTQAGPGSAGSSVSSIAHAVATDVNGNVYVAGETNGNLRNGATTGSMTTNYAGGADVFVAKYDRSGALRWTKLLGSAGNDVAYGIAIDANTVDPNHPNVYITGTTDGNLAGTGLGANDVFVGKMDDNGNTLWTKQFGTVNDDHANTITVDSSGFVFVAGGTYGSMSATNAGPDAQGNITSDLFVTKIDATGGFVWSRQLGTSSNDDAFGVVTDAVGNVFVTGYTFGNLDGNVGTGGADIFVVKYDRLGNKLWSTQLGSPQTDVSKAVATFVGPNGTVQNPTEFLYVAGYTAGNMDTNFNMDATFNSTDYFLVKYNATTGAKF